MWSSRRMRSDPFALTMKTSIGSSAAVTPSAAIASSSRSMPAPKPMPGVGGPPIASISPSYRPPPTIDELTFSSGPTNSKVVRV